ncbi:uncharacterized protein PAC_00815 [Phialocephala subalpina]|uniref:Protein kinase domain-containing protein n=1 Tax=Phialocephala subalpina TaxID=576137 RepID=A0A1L7WDV3_9HELO|nr:uncharacterized protein PAC_00815 [Phialocephala subalpina]
MYESSPVSSHQNEHTSQPSPMSSSLVGQDLQASNLHPNNHGTRQLGQYALVPTQSRLPQPAYSYNAPIERPIPGAQSVQNDPPLAPPYLTDNSAYVGPGQLHCIASPGVQCYCVSCNALADFPITPFDLNSNTSVTNFGPTQSYNSRPRLNTGGYNTGIGGSSLSYSQEVPDLTYSRTGNTGSYLSASPYGSVPEFGRDSAISFGPSSSWSRQASSSVAFPGVNHVFQAGFDDMRGPPPNAPQRLAGLHNVNRKHCSQTKDRVPRQSGPPRLDIVHAPSTETIASLDCATFLEAQEILGMKLKNGKPLSDVQKESLVNLLEMSHVQLDFCLDAKRILEPVLHNLCSKTQACSLPTDYVVRWFEQIQSSHTPEKASLRDSAYQSLNPPHGQNQERPKKRRKTTRDPSQQKVYQCTHISNTGRRCPQESSNFTDWKRHEETHWPQRRWECLIEGSYPDIACHVCGEYIDMNIEQSQHNHAECFGHMPRKGHEFPRKDKLVPHVREEHGYTPKVDSWHYPIPSHWKSLCGFCGLQSFSNWDDRCDHVGKHFTEGKRMVPDWRDPWPIEEVSDAADEDNDDDEDGDGPGHNDGPSDRDAEGEDDPDHGPQSDRNQNSSSGDANQTYNTGSEHGHQDSSHTHGTDNGSHPGNHRGRGAQHWSRGPSVPNSHENLSIRPSLRIHGPGGDDNVFKSIGPLGYGTFGSVDEVEHSATKMRFARKTIRVVHHQSFPAILQAQREVSVLRNLKHVHIVDLAASYTFEDQFSIIISPVAEWNLGEYIRHDISPSSTRISNLARWIGCLASAVSYMHEQSCQHLDIKPSNILIAGSQVMLSDFGGAVILNGSNSNRLMTDSCAVTPMYCAPEIADRRGTSFIAGASDVYSLGCVFLEMATVIHRESLNKFEQFRGFGSKDATYHRNLRKSLLWIDHLLDIDGSLGVPVKDSLSTIRLMLSHDWTKRPTARGIEDSLQLWHLQSKCETEKKNYLIIAQAKRAEKARASFDPLDVVKRWLHNCLSTHTTCTSTEKGFFPSRILNVGVEGDTIRLESSDPSSPYVALSYCWGTTATLKTTSQTLEDMFENIPVSSLSHTFLHAVRITRALGFHYLWIDALCIIQDSLSDWTAQVAQMSKIYSHSSLTICVASETQVPTTPEHKMLDTRPNIGRPESPCPTCDNAYKAFKPLVDDTATTMLLDSQWSKRGWTLQERILSPRILYYSSNSLAWECDGERSTLDRVGQIRDNLKLLGIGKHSLPNKQEANPSFPLMRSFRKTWREIVREFSKRHLTFATDKLPALAGVAYEMAAMSHQSYVAGLWKGDLINDLLWCRDFPTIPLPRPNYRAPSWSWASIDSPVVWSKSVSFPVEKNAQVLDCETRPLSELAPFAGVSDGYLQIRGLSRKVVVVVSRPEEVLDRQSLNRLAFAQWDTLDVQKKTSNDPKLKGVQVEALLCLQILTEAGLLLRDVSEGDLQTFRRVGVYWNQTDDDSKPVFDGSWKSQSVTII